MPPPPGKNANRKNSSSSVSSRARAPDEFLQAVVLLDEEADSQLAPLTLSSPKCLLTVAGAPLLDHTLEFLATQSGTAAIGEALLFTARDGDAVLAWLAQSRWSAAAAAGASGDRNATFRIRVLGTNEARTHGDALRALDEARALRGDGAFVIVEGCVVGAATLNGALAAHSARAAADANTTLTVLVMPRGPHAVVDAPALAVDSRDGRLWAYAPLVRVAASREFTPPVFRDMLWPRRARTSATALAAVTNVKGLSAAVRAHVTARVDFSESGVYIASPQVLVHFSDNADYTCIRAHYLTHETSNVDMGWRFHLHAVDGYLAPVRDVRGLLTAGSDALSRWWSSRRVAAADAAIVDSTASVVRSGLGARTRVCARARVERSELGADCDIGEGASVEGAVLGDRVRVGAGARVPPGAVLAAGVVVAPAQTLPTAQRLVCRNVVGNVGAGVRAWPGSADLWECDDDDDDDSEVDDNDGKAMGKGGSNVVDGGAGAPADAALAKVSAALSEFFAEGSVHGSPSHARVGAAARAALALPVLQGVPGCAALDSALALLTTAPLIERQNGAAAGTGGSGTLTQAARFAQGVADLASSLPAVPSLQDIINVSMEMRAWKAAENATFADVARALVSPMLKAAPRPVTPASLIKTVSAWAPLVARFVPKNIGAAGLDAESALVDAVEATLRSPAGRADGLFPLFGLILNALYDAEAATPLAIQLWAETAQDVEEEEDEEDDSSSESVDAALAADRRELLNTKWVKLLLERVNEDDEEEEEDEE